MQNSRQIKNTWEISPYNSRCRNRARVDVGLSVGISVTVSVPSNKVRVVVVFTKNVVYTVSLVL